MKNGCILDPQDHVQGPSTLLGSCCLYMYLKYKSKVKLLSLQFKAWNEMGLFVPLLLPSFRPPYFKSVRHYVWDSQLSVVPFFSEHYNFSITLQLKKETAYFTDDLVFQIRVFKFWGKQQFSGKWAQKLCHIFNCSLVTRIHLVSY